MPQKWNQLYKLLPNRRRSGSGWEPPLPPILSAWYDTSALLKMMRLAEHIEWAAAQGALDVVGAYIKGLPEEDWFHLDD